MSWYAPLTLAQAEDAPPVPPGQAAPLTNGTTTTTSTPATTGADGKPGQDGQSPSPFGPLAIVTVFFVIMWVFMILPQRREKKKHEALVASLKKGDKVETIGGILGTVLEVRDREVVVKVDEGSNAKIRFSRSAIRSVTESGKE